VTPDDIAAIRRGYLSYSGYPTPDIAELCDACEAAWIRADELAQSLEGETRRVGRERERAERAEAEVERQKALRERDYIDSYDLVEDRQKAEAALARVTALCDTEWELMPGGTYSELVDDRYVSVREIRAAIEGEQ
jgi:hypothetical protein